MAIITTENIYQEVMSPSKFYSLMYPNFVKFYSVEEQIIPIKTSSVRWNPTKTLFYYIWAGPAQIVICMMLITTVKLGLLAKKNCYNIGKELKLYKHQNLLKTKTNLVFF